MFDFYEKRKARNIVYSKPALVILTIITIAFIYSVYGALEKERETRLIRDQRAAVLDELHEREAILQKEIDRLNTGKGLESEIRSKFEVAKEGEEVIVIVEAPREEEEIIIREEKGIFEKLFGL